MGRVLSIIGAGALAVVGLGVVSGGVGYFKASGLNSEGRAFLAQALPPVGTVWDSGKVLNHASAELRRQAEGEPAMRMATEMRKLGVIKAYEPPTDAGFHVNYGPAGKLAVANYAIILHGESGDAKLLVGLIKRGEEAWKLNGLRIHGEPAANAALPQGT